MGLAGTRGVRIQIDRVGKVYGEGTDQAFEALRPTFVDIRPGEFVSVVGPSGCGKSTLLLIVAGLLRASQGTVRVDNKPLSGFSNPARIFSRVDFPVPLGPIKPVRSPSKRPKDRPSKRGREPPKLLVMF